MDREARLARWDALPRPLVTPSILDCDLARVADELLAVERAGAKAVHLDVMDGHFVPNLSYGPPVIASWRAVTDLPFDVHLMMSDPARYLDAFVAAGSDQISIQIEAVPDPSDLLRAIRSRGCRAGLVLNPPTPLDAITPFLDLVDSVLVMSVMPGFGGQSFDRSVLSKTRALRLMRPDLAIAIDGGIKPDTAALAVAAGVTQLVAGSAVFRSHGSYAVALADLARGVDRGRILLRGEAPAPADGASPS